MEGVLCVSGHAADADADVAQSACDNVPGGVGGMSLVGLCGSLKEGENNGRVCICGTC